MTKGKKPGLEENVTTIFIDAEAQDQNPLDLRAKLAAIRELEGVTGYILKDATSALLDLDEPEKIVAYAMLSQEAFESYADLSTSFDLGTTESILIECKDAKMLCATVEQSAVTIIMKKEADPDELLKRILPSENSS